MSEPNKPRRRYQFGLRLLLLAMTLAVAMCAWLTQNSENRAVTVLRNLGQVGTTGETRGRGSWSVR